MRLVNSRYPQWIKTNRARVSVERPVELGNQVFALAFCLKLFREDHCLITPDGRHHQWHNVRQIGVDSLLPKLNKSFKTPRFRSSDSRLPFKTDTPTPFQMEVGRLSMRRFRLIAFLRALPAGLALKNSFKFAPSLSGLERNLWTACPTESFRAADSQIHYLPCTSRFAID